MTDTHTETENPVDLLAALQESLDRAKARLAAERRKATRAARKAAADLPVGTRIRVACPKSDKFHGRTGQVVTDISLGELGVSFGKAMATEAYFTPGELVKV